MARRPFIAAARPRFRDALILAAVMVCSVGTVSCDDGAADQFSFRVARYGCAPDAKTLLVIAVQQSFEKLSAFNTDTVSLVCGYSLIDGSTKSVPDPPSFRLVFDVAFHPSERMLALSDSAGIGLYTWTEASKRWRGLPATCPLEYYYTTLSWSPATGNLLAARCGGYAQHAPTSVLAIYDRVDRSCTITDVPYSYGRAVWVDESTVLVPSEDSVAAVRAKGDDWDVVIRYEKISGSTFLGRFNGDIVQAHDGKVLLGKTVIGVRSSSPLWTLVTDRYIYLCESPSDLKVIGHEGKIVATGNPGGSVRFGCAGDTDDIVYGVLDDKWVVKVTLITPTLVVERLADLHQVWSQALEP